MRKAQAAMEFLLTYGWAILMILVAFGALSYYTGFYQKFLPNKCVTSAPFVCQEYKAAEDGTIYLGVVNTVNDVSWANLTLYCDQERTIWGSYETSRPILIQDRINDTMLKFNCPVDGTAFSGEIEIMYTNVGESTIHYTSGDIRVNVD